MYQILVVEDEEIIRQSIVEEIHRLPFGLVLAGEAGNGKEAIPILKDKPVDIVITDMRMPVCDGRELLRLIEEKGYECEIIVLSEYTNFEYMQQAIHAHVADYLLKPIDPSKLEEILRKTCRRVDEKRRLEINIKDPIDRIFVGAIKKTPAGQMGELFEMYRRLFPQNGLWVSMICVGKDQGELYDGGIQKRLNDLCFEAPFKARIRPYNEGRGMFGLLILIPLPVKAGVTHVYNEWLKEYFRKIKKEFGEQVRIGTGHFSTEIGTFAQTLHHAVRSVEYLVHGRGEIVWYENIERTAHSDMDLSACKIGLQDMIVSKRDLRDQILAAFCRPVQDMEYAYIPALQNAIRDFTFCLERCCQDNGMVININEALQGDCNEIIPNLEWFGEMERFLIRLLDFAWNIVNAQRSLTTKEIIEEIISMVNDKYMEELSLMNFSQKYFINYIYLSRQFKSATGYTFTDFLQKTRMEKARTLIEEYHFDEKDAASMVGYQNVYYFSTAYHKYFKGDKQIG
ncbi:response regulator [Diplocloster agilis]|uniref:Stage 0 sporulation protein A homolog n=1 Tax=Diplocloster agilis TaxID=2850323 RepID=A0A949NC02_9FIRM|nr:response regulator [Diplocloster agilis]MBU9738122.1 response regulator [Diplocloster agilis]MBU9742620.1 response regulator [Diplocloster agilis]